MPRNVPTARTLPSGLIQYGAPPGGHDDLVMALMLAWEGSRFVLTQEQWRAATSLSLVSGGILGDPPLVALLPGSQL